MNRLTVSPVALAPPEAAAQPAEPIPGCALPLRVGIVGLGKIGLKRAEYIQAHPDLSLQAGCDLDPARAATLPDVRFYSDYHDLVQAADLDAIFVATYNNVAPEIVVEALQAGKHVFCEKPPGRSVEDVQRIIRVEQAQPGLRLQFGFNHRHHYAVMEAKAMIESGRFGRLLWLRGVYGKSGGINFENVWRNDKELAGGGILLDQGIHMLDLCRFLAGEFTQVKSLITTSFWDIPLEDNAFAILYNEQQQVAMLHSSATQWKHRFALEICLEEGYINLNGILSSTHSYGDESLTFARRQFEDESFALGRPREETIFFDRDDSWALEIAAFVEAIRQQQPVASGNSHDALRVMELIEQIYKEGQH